MRKKDRIRGIAITSIDFQSAIIFSVALSDDVNYEA